MQDYFQNPDNNVTQLVRNLSLSPEATVVEDRLQLTDNHAIQLLRSLSLLPEPISVKRCTEGGEHMVWMVNDQLVLRVPLFQEFDPEGLARERKVVDYLLRRDSAAGVLARAIPAIVAVGAVQGHSSGATSWRYAVYRKAEGVSLEDRSEAATPATETDLAHLLQSLGAVGDDDEPSTYLGYANPPEVHDLACQARDAWSMLLHQDKAPLLIGRDSEECLQQPPTQIINGFDDDGEERVLSHNDLKAEHLFIDPDTGHVTGAIDWSDVQMAHPGVDVQGLVRSIGAVAAVRVARMAGRSDSIIRMGIFLARCESLILLDEVVNGRSDAPEWLVRRQLERAMERVEL